MTGSWKKPQALQLYHGLLQRYRDWDEDGSAGNEGAAEEVEVAVYRYSSDEDDSDGSGSEIIEFVTPRVRGEGEGEGEGGGEGEGALAEEGQEAAAEAGAAGREAEGDGVRPGASADDPRASWIQPASSAGHDHGALLADAGAQAGAQEAGEGGAVLRRQRVVLTPPSQPSELRSVHVRHAEAAQSSLAALHWRLLREQRVDAVGANLEPGAVDECPDAAEVRRTLELLQHELRCMREEHPAPMGSIEEAGGEADGEADADAVGSGGEEVAGAAAAEDAVAEGALDIEQDPGPAGSLSPMFSMSE